LPFKSRSRHIFKTSSQENKVGIAELILISIPLFAGFIIVMEDKRIASEKK